jgi:Zn-dependent protease
MLRGGIPIGRLFGISLRLNYTWFIVFALVTWSLTVYYFPHAVPHWDVGMRVLAGVITSLLLFGSVLAHELMHSIVAQAFGIPVHSITLFIFGGVARMNEEPKRPRDELWMALAGPLASLVLGGIFYVLYIWIGPHNDFARVVTQWLALINIYLAAFNLVPGFPLDGGRILRSILWWRTRNLRRATRIASNIGRGVGYLFIFAGVFIIFQGLWLNGLWLAIIGWFLENAAVGSYRQVALLDMLQGHTASEVMTRDCPAIPPNITIEALVNEHVLATGRRCFPVTINGRVNGLMTLHNIRAVPRTLWPTKTVQEAMTPLSELKTVRPSEDLAAVLDTLTDEDINQLLVMDGDDIAGVIGRDNILSFINLRGELGA